MDRPRSRSRRGRATCWDFTTGRPHCHPCEGLEAEVCSGGKEMDLYPGGSAGRGAEGRGGRTLLELCQSMET